MSKSHNPWSRRPRGREGRKRELPFLSGLADTTSVTPTMPMDMAKKILRALHLYAGGEYYEEFITLNEVTIAQPVNFTKTGDPIYQFYHGNIRILVMIWNGEARAVMA
jgi:hypothetical protein